MKEAQQSEYVGEIRRVTRLGAFANLCLAAGKMLVGWIAQSQALVADGVHSLSDLVTDGVILVGAGYWSAPPDDEHPYGHGRIETLISISIGIALIGVGIGLGWRAVVSIPQAAPSPPGMWAMVIAVIAIVAKEALYRKTAKTGKRLRSRALVANAWHHRADALSSVPVAASVIGSRMFPSLTYLDPMAAILVSAMIFKAAWRIGWPGVCEITERRGFRELDDLLKESKKSFPAIREIHRARSRRVGGSLLVDLHMLVDPAMSVEESHRVAEELKQRLMERNPSLADVLVHVEPYSGAREEFGRDQQD